MKIWRGLTVVPLRAVPARVARRSGRTRRIGGRHGRAGDAPLGRASTTVGVWTRAVTSARLDRLHQLDGAARCPRAAPGLTLIPSEAAGGPVSGCPSLGASPNPPEPALRGGLPA